MKMDLSQSFTLLGLILNTAGGFYLIVVMYNPKEMDTAKPMHWKPPLKEGDISYETSWSKLGKGVAIGVGLTVLGFLLQIIGLFV